MKLTEQSGMKLFLSLIKVISAEHQLRDMNIYSVRPINNDISRNSGVNKLDAEIINNGLLPLQGIIIFESPTMKSHGPIPPQIMNVFNKSLAESAKRPNSDQYKLLSGLFGRYVTSLNEKLRKMKQEDCGPGKGWVDAPHYECKNISSETSKSNSTSDVSSKSEQSASGSSSSMSKASTSKATSSSASATPSKSSSSSNSTTATASLSEFEDN